MFGFEMKFFSSLHIHSHASHSPLLLACSFYIFNKLQATKETCSGPITAKDKRDSMYMKFINSRGRYTLKFV